MQPMQPNQPSWKSPGLRALFYQFSAFLVTSLVTGLFASLLSLEAIQPRMLLAVAAFQGLLAAGFSWWRGLSVWWVPIQFVFPVAVIGLQAVALPSWMYLCVFLLLLGLYWSSFRTQVPYYPSGRAVSGAVAELLPDKDRVRFMDIGSGFGGLVLDLAKMRPSGQFEGIEIAPLPWLVSRLRARWRGTEARFSRGDYEHLQLSHYDVVFAYLSPAAMPGLWEKARREMRSGALLLSLEFSVPDVQPHFLVHPDSSGPVLYGWRF